MIDIVCVGTRRSLFRRKLSCLPASQMEPEKFKSLSEVYLRNENPEIDPSAMTQQVV
jgi:hypothetical protein